MEKKKNILFISCDEAKHICDKSQYGEASFWEKVKLNLRLSWCRVTQAYTKKNRKLTDLMNQANGTAMNTNSKDEMRKKLQEKLSQ